MCWLRILALVPAEIPGGLRTWQIPGAGIRMREEILVSRLKCMAAVVRNGLFRTGARISYAVNFIKIIDSAFYYEKTANLRDRGYNIKWDQERTIVNDFPALCR
jgi:hypothetical protein